jgi:methionine aminopeptidase
MTYRVVASALDHVEHFIREGASTYDVDKEVELYAVLKNVTSATLGYKGFPNSCCISVNDVVLQCVPCMLLVATWCKSKANPFLNRHGSIVPKRAAP